MNGEAIITAASWIVAASWMGALFSALVSLRSRRLSAADAKAAGDGTDAPPKVSVIVAAKDEEEDIERTLRSLALSEYPDLEVIAVNDRSTDRTPEIMDAVAAEFPQVIPVHIAELPDDWLGKNHAMHCGAERATGDYLIFTDGDIIFESTLIRQAAGHIKRRNLDHLCLIPQLLSEGYLENALVTSFSMIFLMGAHPVLVSSNWKRFYAGVGAFNMVRTTAYREAGGHLPIRMDVLDDVKLGKLMKQASGRVEVLLAGKKLQVRWQKSSWQVICGLEKNGFASMGYSLLMLTRVTLFAMLVVLLPYLFAAIAPTSSARWAWGLMAAGNHVAYGVLGVVFGSGLWIFPLFPVALSIIMFAFWRSAWKTLRRGGISWRDTFYPLDVLKDRLY